MNVYTTSLQRQGGTHTTNLDRVPTNMQLKHAVPFQIDQQFDAACPSVSSLAVI